MAGLGKLALTGAALLAALALAAGVGAFLWGGVVGGFWKGQATAQAGKAEHATDDAVGRGLEVEGARNMATAASQLQRAAADLQRQTNAFDLETRADPDTALRLPDSELVRLRAHDRLLCDQAPALDGCAAPAP